jgi:hypothetical protein
MAMSPRLPPCRCLQCGELLNRVIAVGLFERPPKSGDATICHGCGHIMIFNDELLLREPNADEQRSLDRDVHVQIIRTLYQQFLKERTKH